MTKFYASALLLAATLAHGTPAFAQSAHDQEVSSYFPVTSPWNQPVASVGGGRNERYAARAPARFESNALSNRDLVVRSHVQREREASGWVN